MVVQFLLLHFGTIDHINSHPHTCTHEYSVADIIHILFYSKKTKMDIFRQHLASNIAFEIFEQVAGF